MPWRQSPISRIQYRDFDQTEFPTKIPPILEIESIDDIFLHTLRAGTRPKADSRMRWRNPGDRKWTVIPVFFYNENDRIKSNKENPMFIVRPFEPAPVDDHVRTDLTVRCHPSNMDQRVVNFNATYIEFKYRVTASADTFDMYRRMATFLTEVIFPLQRGQRWIKISQTTLESGAIHENRRTLSTIDVSQSEDFENNHFQFDITYSFRVALYVTPWEVVPGIDQVIITSIDETFETVTDPNDALALGGQYLQITIDFDEGVYEEDVFEDDVFVEDECPDYPELL